ncbi:ABC transporter permease [Paenibacillus lactis]|uniref:ABC transporter permease n=1 Tax=Paenibacillus lactis TaxID=228574 RepID=UPI00203E0B6B|nr:ABC transporter permease [Paenibacillus lactis]MCM3493411.1 ABC transporter permease [Paenibacillus lactis]
MSFWRNRQLILQFVKRDISSRYKGSYLGAIWSILTPLFMLAIYTFVFSVIFQAKWNIETENKLDFAFIIFSGIIAFNVFSDVILRSPNLIISNVNFVKKIVFPLEILVVVAIGSSLFLAGINVLILVLGQLLFNGVIHWTIILLPIVLLPLVLITLGLGWFLASLGTYYRDISHIIGLIVSALMFMSPIFYPVSNIPENLRGIYTLNPITHIVEDMRRVIVFGQMPNWGWILVGSAIGLVVSLLGLKWFNKTRGGFSDVL